eukprot:m.888653 g.888653  ORF g.888653 m.888653 type:complete len:51 (-) comp59934_c0_seq6:79-231(-)
MPAQALVVASAQTGFQQQLDSKASFSTLLCAISDTPKLLAIKQSIGIPPS